MVDYPMVTRAAYAATLQAGIDRNSPDFAAAMEGNFASLLNRAQAQAQSAAVNPAAQPASTPEFFQTPPPAGTGIDRPRPPMYSAPVSRREAGRLSRAVTTPSEIDRRRTTNCASKWNLRRSIRGPQIEDAQRARSRGAARMNEFPHPADTLPTRSRPRGTRPWRGPEALRRTPISGPSKRPAGGDK